jgi:hypothetical protein
VAFLRRKLTLPTFQNIKLQLKVQTVSEAIKFLTMFMFDNCLKAGNRERCAHTAEICSAQHFRSDTTDKLTVCRLDKSSKGPMHPSLQTKIS